ncbi:TetR/AcrR family transcriptional regulator [Herbiconiux ginsengi]|uniref:Transcriptional regulator, TetR family n=1 Tax=Herbiconiux ginsengi TaxID=381665 RepID=A0A1H3TDR9_9MICO|nr:TetR/AcrR family transcriptional regulator [Herbiconiux ginsengi]SDZ47835.1 transcriptional regulator, TetR family [Herbiconiux ginsengi]
MSANNASPSRRERNKQAKLERIIAAASELFALHGVDEVTTQQIADRADIGTGTLFLYAKTKGELLLLVQNARYEAALKMGQAEAQTIPNTLDAVMAIVRSIVECNRTQVDNGRTYLREVVFGDAQEIHHVEALAIVARTEEAVATIARRGGVSASDSAIMSRITSAIMFLSMAAGLNAALDVDSVVEDIRQQVYLLLGPVR